MLSNNNCSGPSGKVKGIRWRTPGLRQFYLLEATLRLAVSLRKMTILLASGGASRAFAIARCHSSLPRASNLLASASYSGEFVKQVLVMLCPGPACAGVRRILFCRRAIAKRHSRHIVTQLTSSSAGVSAIHSLLRQ